MTRTACFEKLKHHAKNIYRRRNLGAFLTFEPNGCDFWAPCNTSVTAGMQHICDRWDATYLWPMGCNTSVTAGMRAPQHPCLYEVSRASEPAWTWWQTLNLWRFQESKSCHAAPKLITKLNELPGSFLGRTSWGKYLHPFIFTHIKQINKTRHWSFELIGTKDHEINFRYIFWYYLY